MTTSNVLRSCGRGYLEIRSMNNLWGQALAIMLAWPPITPTEFLMYVTFGKVMRDKIVYFSQNRGTV